METTQGTSFGALLKRYRVAAGLSQEALAERAHMSVRGVSDLERGVRRAPHKETLSQLIDALELQPEDRAELEAASQRFRRSSPPRHEASDLDPTLLETKLMLPPASSRLVPRSRLVERLEAGLRGPLTLVSAPAGYGKTTLIRAWRASPTGRTAALAWVSLDPEDSDPVVFWRYVCTALDRAAPGTGKTSLAMLRSPQPPSISVIVTQMINALSAVDAMVVLALDDYHVVESESIHQGLAFLLDHLPSSLHLLIASRADPPLPLSRLRARRLVVEIVADDLRFTPNEASSYLRDVMDLALTSDAIVDLEARTEGWIAGLQLAALSLQGRPPEAVVDFIAAFTGSHRHVVDYLADEVLARQSEPVQTFLLRTSILERLSASLCAFVMDGESSPEGVASSQRLLEDLERRNVFLVALDEERRWYRYHHLFRDALRNHLRHSSAEVVSELHLRASDWYANHGMVDDAVGHALSATSFGDAVRLVHGVVWQYIAQGRMQTLRTWLDALPDAVVRTQPRLSAAQVFLLLDAGDVHGSESYLQDAEAAFRGMDQSSDSRVIEGEILAAGAMLAAARGDASQVIAHGRDALDRLDVNNVALHELVSVILSMAYLAHADLPLAAQSFAAGAARARGTGNVRTALSAEVSLSYVQRAQGALHLAVQTCRESLVWSHDHATEFPMTGGLHLNLADIHREWNDLDTAMRHATQAKAILDDTGRFDLRLLGFLGLARVAHAQGDLDGALALLGEATTLAEQFQAAWGLALLHACRAQVWLAQENLEAAIRWADETARQERTRPALTAAFFIYAHEHSIAAPLQVLLAQARSSGERAALYTCLGRLEHERSEAERTGLRWLQIKTRVLEAVAFQTLGDHVESQNVLNQALTLAEPEGYVRVFADEGATLEPLLRDRTAAGTGADYIARVLSALPQR